MATINPALLPPCTELTQIAKHMDDTNGNVTKRAEEEEGMGRQGKSKAELSDSLMRLPSFDISSSSSNQKMVLMGPAFRPSGQLSHMRL